MGKKQAEEIIRLATRIKHRNDEIEADFYAAIGAIEAEKPVSLLVDGQLIPLVVSDLQVSHDVSGLTDIKIVAYPQPPRML